MRKSDPIQDELDKIRIQIYEETKHMSPAELDDYFTTITEKAAKKYGFKFEKPLNSKNTKQNHKK
jgi:hypothetical protein